MPPRVQRLIRGTVVMEGGQNIAEHCVGLRDGEPLAVMFVYVPPFNGDIQQAAAAQDRDAVRMLIQFRDKDRAQRVPAGLQILMHPFLRDQRSWPKINDALVDIGYSREQANSARAASPCDAGVAGPTYNEVLAQLESTVGAPTYEPGYLKWWCLSPEDCASAPLAC